jgi:CrcB protein
VVNVTGAFLLGFLFTMLTERVTVSPWIRSTVTIGFLGAYTTFFDPLIRNLSSDRGWGVCFGDGEGSLTAGLLADYAGVVLGRVV